MIGWSNDRLGLPSAPLHYGLKWPVGIPTVFQTPVTVPLHCNCLPLGLCKGTVKESTVVSHGRLLPGRGPTGLTGPGPKSEPAGKSESRGPENWVSRWRRPNSDIYSQNHHFGLVYDMIYQFLGMEAKNYKIGMFCQQCHPSVASGDADIRPRNASRIHTCHLFTS